MSLSRSLQAPRTLGIIVAATAVVACSSESPTRPLQEAREAVVAHLDSALRAAYPGGEQQSLLAGILVSLGSGAPIDTLRLSVNGTPVTCSAVAMNIIGVEQGLAPDSGMNIVAWSGDDADTTWAIDVNGDGSLGPLDYNVDSVLFAEAGTPGGSMTAFPALGSCASLRTPLPEALTTFNGPCQLQTFTVTISGNFTPGLNKLGVNTLDVSVPTQRLHGMRVIEHENSWIDVSRGWGECGELQ